MGYRDAFVECRDCGAPCVWMKTYSGKNILVDRDSFDGEPTFDRSKNKCHWEHCGTKTEPSRKEPPPENPFEEPPFS